MIVGEQVTIFPLELISLIPQGCYALLARLESVLEFVEVFGGDAGIGVEFDDFVVQRTQGSIVMCLRCTKVPGVVTWHDNVHPESHAVLPLACVNGCMYVVIVFELCGVV